MKRQFNSEKLYKLTRFFVIAITLICAYLVYTNNQNYNQTVNQFNKDSNDCTNQYNSDLKNDPKFANYSLNECYKFMPNADSVIEEIQQANMDKFGLTAILLPLIFFGGRLVFKYIFPVKKQNK